MFNDDIFALPIQKLIDSATTRGAVRFALLCAERVVYSVKQRYPEENRAEDAMLAAKRFLTDGVTVSEARKAAFAAKEAAGSVEKGSAERAACWAAAHAVLAVESKKHAMFCAEYSALSKSALAKDSYCGEREWQYNMLLSLSNENNL